MPQAIATIRRAFPGVLAALTIAFAARFLSEHYGGPSMLFALLLGMAFHFLSEDEKCRPGIDVASKRLLRVGVALLGLRISFDDMQTYGMTPLILVLVGVSSTILVGLVLSRLFGLRRRFGILTGGAVAICGASAALAISAALPDGEDKERDTLFTVMGVTSLSTVAMILYPLVAAMLGFSDLSSGYFVGATIHDVAQVVGAGYSIGPKVGDIATYTKLLRVACLIPVVFGIAFVFRKEGGARAAALPLYLIGFVAMVVVGSFSLLPEPVEAGLIEASRVCLISAVSAIGVKTSLGSLRAVGLKPVLLITLETVILAVLIATILAFGWI